MAGIYIHIPFCKSKCLYCNFCSVAEIKQTGTTLKAIMEEIGLRRKETSETIETIYFGGGTPSLPDPGQIGLLISHLANCFTISSQCEITIEVNPDDVHQQYVKRLAQTPVNRVSIGFQSADDHALRYLGRRHTADQAKHSVKLLQDAGVENLSADLIFGIPAGDENSALKSLMEIISLGVKHISAYALTVEPGTPLAGQIARKDKSAPDEEQICREFYSIRKYLLQCGFLHYEISNYSLPGMESKHNTAYWKMKPYLGFGPSAHSYNGNLRSWNTPDLSKYCNSISQGVIPGESESLSFAERYHEFVMLRLRTSQGININQLREKFGKDRSDDFTAQAEYWIERQKMEFLNEVYCLSEPGLIYADGIAASFFTDL